MASKINKEKTKPKSHPQDSIPSFIRKTYDILEERKFPDIIDWNPEGTALVIKKPAEFCQKVLPAYFKHNNLTSFVRQLNMYNFHKRRTQNIDHVYYHELFQKGKKSLLKDIKRKNHVHALEKAQKASENLENAQNAKDFSSLAYENQLLKRLYNDAMAKIATLETQVTEMTQQNQSLWVQAQEGEGVVKCALAKLEKPDELNQEKVKVNELTIPPLKLESEGHVSLQPIWPFGQNSSVIQTNCYIKHRDESGDSTTTERSHNSPNLQQNGEIEKYSDISEVSRIPQQFQFIPQISSFQAQRLTSELVISRKETSVGQLFGFWDTENPSTGNEYLYFADQKADKNYAKLQPTFYETTLLKKRQFDLENINREAKPFDLEPRLKRHDLSIFSRKSMISTGTEEKDMLGVSLQRESLGNEEYECVDLMDFNQPFCG